MIALGRGRVGALRPKCCDLATQALIAPRRIRLEQAIRECWARTRTARGERARAHCCTHVHALGQKRAFCLQVLNCNAASLAPNSLPPPEQFFPPAVTLQRPLHRPSPPITSPRLHSHSCTQTQAFHLCSVTVDCNVEPASRTPLAHRILPNQGTCLGQRSDIIRSIACNDLSLPPIPFSPPLAHVVCSASGPSLARRCTTTHHSRSLFHLDSPPLLLSISLFAEQQIPLNNSFCQKKAVGEFTRTRRHGS